MNRFAWLSGICVAVLVAIAIPAVAQQGTARFDHSKTGFPLTGGHMTVECVTCHINGRLAGTPRMCVACHNGTLAPGMPSGHIPTAVSCETCHRNPVAFGPGTRMNHSGITSCNTCHDGTSKFFGVTPVSKSSTHMATTPANKDCVDCHRSYVSFQGATGDAMPTNHIPTSQTCTLCHASGYSPTLTQMSHSGITSGCTTCHNGTVFYGVTPVSKGSTHITSTQDCSVCHSSTTTPGGFATGKMSHTGITSGCATCHGTSAGIAFQNVTPMAESAVNHVPTGSVSCETCHTSTTVPGGFASFTMGTAGHSALGVSTGSSCLTCHGTSAQIYFGVKAESDYSGHVATGSTNCTSCHTGGFTSFAGASGALPTNHIPVGSLPCARCHANGYSTTLTKMSHTGITSGCANCHNGTAYFNTTPVAVGSNHVKTTQDCSVCHSSTATPGGFATGTMSHTGITSGCATCHSGAAFQNVTPVSMGSNHIKTTQDCSVCHSSTTVPGGFATGTMSHTGITSGCATCHGTSAGIAFQNVTPMAESAVNHVPTGSVSCETCHTSTTVPGGFASFTMGTAGHSALGVSTGSSCLTCHGTSAQIYFGVKAESDYSGHAATGSTNCTSCHTGGFTSFAGASGALPTNHIPVGTLPCAQCHANGYSTTLTKMSHTGITSGCTNCHNGAAYYNVTPVSVGTNHIKTTQDCSVCHSSTTTPGGFATGTMSHTGITSGCATCHGTSAGIAFQNVTPMAESAVKHVPTGSVSCETCHASTTVPGGFASFTMGTAGHSALGVSTGSSCLTCHGTSAQIYFGVKAESDYSGHAATGSTNCTSCHTGGFTSFAGASGGAMPTNHIPTTQTCTLCHASGYSTTLTKMSHSGITSGCATCHKGTAFYGVTPVSKAANHLTTTLDCSTCHKSTTAFSGTAMNHTGISSGCATCHAGQTFQNGVSPVSKGTTHFTTTGDCVSCHTSFTSFATATMSHAVVSGTCASCHGGQTFQNVTPVTKAANHITTSIDCTNCHKSTTVFGPGTAMNHTGISSGCATCHSGSAYQGVTPVSKSSGHFATTADCSTCHKSFTSFLGATYNHGTVTSGCATCHTGTGGVVGKGTNHLPTTLDCSTCHKSTTSFTGTAMNHTGITTCATCHSGTAYQGVTPVSKPTTGHIPTNGADCSTCHKSFTSFLGATYVHTAAAGLCATCHNGSYPGVMSVSSAAKHVAILPTTSCDGCHKGSTTVGGFATATMGSAGHNLTSPPTTTATVCANCHYTSIALGANKLSHHHTNVSCLSCHQHTGTGFTSDPN